jgi:hypothetical protein
VEGSQSKLVVSRKKEENKERNDFSEKHIGWNENNPGQTAGSEEETPWQ